MSTADLELRAQLRSDAQVAHWNDAPDLMGTGMAFMAQGSRGRECSARPAAHVRLVASTPTLHPRAAQTRTVAVAAALSSAVGAGLGGAAVHPDQFSSPDAVIGLSGAAHGAAALTGLGPASLASGGVSDAQTSAGQQGGSEALRSAVAALDARTLRGVEQASVEAPEPTAPDDRGTHAATSASTANDGEPGVGSEAPESLAVNASPVDEDEGDAADNSALPAPLRMSDLTILSASDAVGEIGWAALSVAAREAKPTVVLTGDGEAAVMWVSGSSTAHPVAFDDPSLFQWEEVQPAVTFDVVPAPEPEPTPTDVLAEQVDAADQESAELRAMATSLDTYTNGHIPQGVLCAIDFDKAERLRCDAARQLERLNEAYRAEFGEDIVVGNSYRSYASQEATKATKGWLAATPGRSQHGWGVAVDLSGRAANDGTPEHEWIVEHGPELGWSNPDWARAGGEKPEPWHFEYTNAN